MFEVFRKSSQLTDRNETNIETFSDIRKYGILFIFFVTLFFAAAIAMVMGAYDISFTDVYATIFANIGLFGDISNVSKLHNTIIWNIRLPRILLAITVGAALASSGAVFQGCFRNPLVEPYILGVSSGAAFGAALGIVYPSVFSSVQISAFVFGSLASAGCIHPCKDTWPNTNRDPDTWRSNNRIDFFSTCIPAKIHGK